MKSKKSIWSLLLLVVAMLAAVQFSCKKDEGDDEETSTKTWDCVLDITNNRSETLYLMYGSQKVAVVGGGKSLNATIQVIGSPVTLFLKNDSGDTFCSKTLTTGDGYSVVVAAEEKTDDKKETEETDKKETEETDKEDSSQETQVVWSFNYDINNYRDETVYLYVEVNGEEKQMTGGIGQDINMTGTINISSSDIKFVTVYVKNENGDKFEEQNLKQGNNYSVSIYSDCYYDNKFSLRIINKKSDPYIIYVEGIKMIELESGYEITYSLPAGTQLSLKAVQASGYVLWATEIEESCNVSSCETYTWTLD